MPKSIVTGGAGFIGSNLVDKLLDLGHEVYCIDNQSSSYDNKYYWNENAINYNIDIKSNKIEFILKNTDYVFHLAAQSRIEASLKNPNKTIEDNILGTLNILEYSRQNNIKILVFSSTSSIYGNNKIPNKESQKEDCLNPYSISKFSCEKLCKMYYEIYKLKTIILRYFNVYGPREPQESKYAPIIGKFLYLNNKGLPLTINGDGNQRRDFTHVLDVVNANILSIEKDIKEKYYGKVFNVGSGTNISIKQIADIISNKIVYCPKKAGESKETMADNLKIKKALGWKPTIKLNNYLKS